MAINDSPESSAENLPASPPLISSKTDSSPVETQGLTSEQKKVTIIAVVVLILLGVSILGSIAYLLNQTPEKVAVIRDVFIIFMAVQSILTGLALVILMVQLARLINLLQNEIKPILDSTNETVSNLRGTTVFLSDNLVEPVIKLNEILAVLQRVTDIFKLTRKR